MVFTASNELNDILSQIKTHYIVNLLHLRKPYFKYLSASMKIVAEMIEPYFVNCNSWWLLKTLFILYSFIPIFKISYLFCIPYRYISFHLYTFYSLSFSFSQHLYPVCMFFLLNINLSFSLIIQS